MTASVVSSLVLDLSFPSPPSLRSSSDHIIEVFKDVTGVLLKKIHASERNRISTLLVESSQGDIAGLIRLYKNNEDFALVTISIEWPNYLIDNAAVMDLEQKLRSRLANESVAGEGLKARYLPIIKRGAFDKQMPYLTTSDDRLIQYSLTDVLFEKASSFQQIKIVDSVDHGKILLLDDLVNLGESDRVAYTHALMDVPKIR